MKYFAFSLLFVLQFRIEVFSQMVCGARMAALSGSAITQSDAFSGFHNLSASASVKGSSFAIYGQNPYGIVDIKDAGAAVLQHLGTGVMGVVFHSYGNTQFVRQRLGVGYALPLSNKFSAAVGLSFSSTRISNGYGKAHTLWVNAGATYEVRKDWIWGLVMDLPGSAMKNEEDLPASLKLGTSYFFGKQVALSAQVISTTSAQSSLSYSFGVEYIPLEALSLRFGTNALLQSMSLGVGTKFRNYSFDAAAIIHPQLGITPQISLVYGFEK